MNCRVCGAEHPADATFCMKCGTRLTVVRNARVDVVPEGRQDPTPTMMIGLSASPQKIYAEQLRSFVGRNAKYYMAKWKSMDNSAGLKSLISWNWSAFFFCIGWFGFRKMYLAAIAVAAALLAANLSPVSSSIPLPILLMIDVVLWVGAGVLGNFLYRKQADKFVEEVRGTLCETGDQQVVLARLGGTSAIGAIALPVVSVFLLAVLVLATSNAAVPRAVEQSLHGHTISSGE